MSVCAVERTFLPSSEPTAQLCRSALDARLGSAASVGVGFVEGSGGGTRHSTFIGRPRGPQMPCGWGCGAKLTGIQMRAHFTICPNRPAISDGVLQPAALVVADRGLPDQNEPERRPGAKRGRPPGRRMPCGWLCGAELTASQMRTHFTRCSRRPND